MAETVKNPFFKESLLDFGRSHVEGGNRKSEVGKSASNAHLVPYSDFRIRTSDFIWWHVQSPEESLDTSKELIYEPKGEEVY